MNITKSCFKNFIKNFISEKKAKRIIYQLCELHNLDLLKIAQRRIGILNYQNLSVSGESFLFENTLPKLINSKKPIIIDVGANNGKTTISLRRSFPDAQIFAFEPNKETYEILIENCRGLNINCVNKALGKTEEERTLYSYKTNIISGHASLYQEVFTDIHNCNETEKFKIKTISLDNFTEKNKIDIIDFIKVDTEGHEFSILQGAEKLIQQGRIKSIQFEFNEMNVISRVFLRDFYNILTGFNFYRLTEGGLINLGPYNTRNEIFKFQNILAIKEKT